jgi:phage gp37-like protein
MVKYEDDDKKTYVTESGPKVPEFEEALQAKRIIFLKDMNADPQTASELVNERIGELLSAASETSEYIQTVNNHLDKQKIKVDELKKLQKIFEKQLSDLDDKKSK